MPGQILYMKCNADVEVSTPDVLLKDVASLQCADEHILAKCKCIRVHRFSASDNAGDSSEEGGKTEGKPVNKQPDRRFDKPAGKPAKKNTSAAGGRKKDTDMIFRNVFHNVRDSVKMGKRKRAVISALKLVSMIEDTCPGVQVELIGETEVLIEYISQAQHGIRQWIKIIVICLVCFFGTAFTIMAYHNDVGIREVFEEVFRIVMHEEPGNVNILEISYSIGLASGIILFFNHIGKLKITKDPTPIEVSMKNYERDVNKAIVEIAERKGEEIDV